MRIDMVIQMVYGHMPKWHCDKCISYALKSRIQSILVSNGLDFPYVDKDDKWKVTDIVTLNICTGSITQWERVMDNSITTIGTP
jgi:hypothetical protein